MKNTVAGFDGEGRLLVRVRASPIDGAANRACVHLLARELSIAKSQVVLVRGARARQKIFHVPLPADELRGLLNRANAISGGDPE